MMNRDTKLSVGLVTCLTGLLLSSAAYAAGSGEEDNTQQVNTDIGTSVSIAQPASSGSLSTPVNINLQDANIENQGLNTPQLNEQNTPKINPKVLESPDSNQIQVPEGATTAVGSNMNSGMSISPESIPNLEDTTNIDQVGSQIENIDTAAIENIQDSIEALGAADLEQSIIPETGLGGQDDGGLDELGKLGGDGTGIENAAPIPDATTPGSGSGNSSDGSNISGAPTTPTGDLAGIMGGAASTDSGPVATKTVEERPARGGSNFLTTVTYEDGSKVVSQETWSSGGNLMYRSIIRVNSEGNVTSHRVRGSHHRERSAGPLDPNYTKDPDSADDDGSWARWMAKWSGQKPDLSFKKPDQVDPGEDDGLGNTPPKLILSQEQIAGDPSLHESQQSHGTLDPDTAKKMFEDIIPGPDPMPEDPD